MIISHLLAPDLCRCSTFLSAVHFKLAYSTFSPSCTSQINGHPHSSKKNQNKKTKTLCFQTFSFSIHSIILLSRNKSNFRGVCLNRWSRMGVSERRRLLSCWKPHFLCSRKPLPTSLTSSASDTLSRSFAQKAQFCPAGRDMLILQTFLPTARKEWPLAWVHLGVNPSGGPL